MNCHIPRRIFFAGFRPPTDAEIEWLVASGCELVIFGLDDEDDDRRGVEATDYNDTWTLRRPWRNGALERAIEACHAAGLLVGVHYWLRPVKKWLDGAHRFIRDLVAVYDLFVVMGDFEKHGLQLDPVRGGFESWEDCVRWLEREWQMPPAGVLWPLYALAVYGWDSPRARWLAGMLTVAFIVLMVYGDEKHTGTVGEAIALYLTCLRRWAQVDTGALVIPGGGTYDQARPAERVSGPAMIRRTNDALLEAGSVHRAYWSLPNCRTKPYRRAVSAAFDSLEAS